MVTSDIRQNSQTAASLKLIAVLSWYEESPSWLSAVVASAAKVCDHIVAVDGAYALFPEARASSSAVQGEVILETATHSGIGCTVHRPQRVWAGNEIEKRTFLMQLGCLVGELYEDWMLIIDGDEVLTHHPPDLHERLERTEEHVGGITLWWWDDPAKSRTYEDHMRKTWIPDTPSMKWEPRLMRCLPNMRLVQTHYHYLADSVEGETLLLRGLDPDPDVVPRADFNDVRLEHRHHFRSVARVGQKQAYYLERDQHGHENHVNLMA